MEIFNKNKVDEHINGPFESNIGSFLMCPPFNISSKTPNNPWMEDQGSDVHIDRNLAFNEWLVLHNYLGSNALVYTLPNKVNLQDQIYVANLGIVLPHLEERTVVISNFKSPPRIDEAQVGIDFFKMMDFNVHQSPYHFEGEADLKFLRENIYFGGYGIRSDKRTYDWMEEKYGMKIVPILMEDNYLYHLDCMIFPINTQTVMMCTEIVDEETIEEVEKYAEIVDVNIDIAYQGICNSVRNSGLILQSSNLQDLELTDETYDEEKSKVETTVKICQKYGLEPLFVNLSEAMKSGAMLSCCVMHLNYNDYEFNNV